MKPGQTKLFKTSFFVHVMLRSTFLILLWTSLSHPAADWQHLLFFLPLHAFFVCGLPFGWLSWIFGVVPWNSPGYILSWGQWFFCLVKILHWLWSLLVIDFSFRVQMATLHFCLSCCLTCMVVLTEKSHFLLTPVMLQLYMYSLHCISTPWNITLVFASILCM